MLLHEQFGQSVTRAPNATALVTTTAKHTYADVDARSNEIAAWLQSRGVVRGDRVIIYLDNSAEFVGSWYAALKCGAVAVPVNASTKADKLRYLLNDSQARAFIGHAPFANHFLPPLEQSPWVEACLIVGDDLRVAVTDPRCLRYSEMDRSLTLKNPGLIDQDLAAIIYTSGSTGEPKGVMLSHLNMVSAARSVSTYLGYRASDIILCGLPLTFDYGLYQVLMAFLVGASVVVEQGLAFPARIIEVMRTNEVTVLPGVPTVFSMLLGHAGLREKVPDTLRMITNTAAALPPSHIEVLRAAFPRATLFSMYGLTECKRVTYLPPDQLDIRPGSVGRGMPNEEVWLEDDDGNRLPNGSTGELIVRGSNVMRGYWRKPEATAKRLKPGAIPAENVLRTGDIFRTDSEGYLYFVARKDDIIKSRGEKVSPKEVEGVLYALDGVLEVAVIGVPDDLLGQAIKAFIVLRAGATYTEREVIRHCLSKLESFMAPKFVVFVDSLPKTNTGKISKTGLS